MPDKRRFPVNGRKDAVEDRAISEGSVAASKEGGLAKWQLFQRRQRETLLGQELAADPAWTMLLNLFVACEEGRSMEVLKLCTEAGAPPATALRWISTLADRGDIVWKSRTDDPFSGHVELAPQMADRLRSLFRPWMDRV